MPATEAGVMDRPMEHRYTILAPLDGSSYSEAILGTVARLAGPLRARVVLLLVAAPSVNLDRPLPAARPVVGARVGAPPTPNGALQQGPAPAVRVAPRRVADMLTDYLRRQATELPGAAVRCVVDVADDPAGVIIETARQEHADLIAMATHGRTGLMRRLTGSVTERVIRAGVAPVVVLRP
jgi:nucleotide-binding universal stress UspA family protein